MKKINILKNSRDFDRIIKNNKPYKFKDYIIYIEKETNDIYHFGLSVGKKIGNAVHRNFIKRRLLKALKIILQPEKPQEKKPPRKGRMKRIKNLPTKWRFLSN